MAMLTIDTFLHALDSAWRHDWESLEPMLEGVTEEEAAWQAPCYRNEAAEEGQPSVGTIRWQVAHVAHFKREYTARLKGDLRDASPILTPRSTASFAEDMAELRATHEAQRAALARLPDDALTPDVAEFIAGIIRHDIWHGGQIAMARRLYRTRGPG